MTTIREIKTRLRNKSIKAAIFDSTSSKDKEETFVTLDEAIAAIDEIVGKRNGMLSVEEIQEKILLDKSKQ